MTAHVSSSTATANQPFSPVDFALIGTELFANNRRGQIDVVRDNDGAPQKAVEQLDLSSLGLGRNQHRNDLASLGNDHPSQLAAADPVQNVEALRLELRGVEGLNLIQFSCPYGRPR